jgi:hypothetical protein
MSKPAPTPYRVEPYVDGIDIFDATGKCVAAMADREILDIDGMPPANAAFIVAACNSHGPLVEAVKALLPFAEEAMPPATHAGSCGPESGCDGDCMARAEISRLIVMARTAVIGAKK